MALIVLERIDGDGRVVRTELRDEGETLALHEGDVRVGAIPLAVFDRVMERYGKPLDDGVPLEGPRLALAGGRAIVRLRHRARYDVLPKEFLVLTRPGEEPLAELATSICAALVHLARAIANPA